MSRFELMILGGGLTAARAIKEYRAAGGGGRIALLTKERALPYHRPPLSKRFMRGEAESKDTFVEPQEFYDHNEVELLLGREATAVDLRERTVMTDDGSRLPYRKILVATGAKPRALDVEGADLPGVFSLRSLQDAASIREAASQARDAVVVGSGFIGMEVAASLTEVGLDVTLVSRDIDLFAPLGSPEISEHLIKLYRQRGVHVLRGDEVRAFRGRSRVDTVELHVGDPIGAGLVVVGVGVRPAVPSFVGAIAVEDGIVVDERFQTTVPGVYAAGDVARFFDPVFRRQRRIEHWSNANYQGSEAGKVLAGKDGGYDTVSTFFTESFGLTLRVFGDVSQHDDRITRGSFADGNAIVFYLERGRLVGTLHTGQDEETEQALKRLIRTQAEPHDIHLLGDEAVPVDAAFANNEESTSRLEQIAS